MSHNAIAAKLNERNVGTARGLAWTAEKGFTPFQSEQPCRRPAISHLARSFSRLFGVLAHPFAHEVDMISQHVEHARIGDWHFEVVCLLLEAVEPRDHLAHVAPAGRWSMSSSARVFGSP